VGGTLPVPAEPFDVPQAERAMSPAAARTKTKVNARLVVAISSSFGGVSKEALNPSGWIHSGFAARHVQPEDGALTTIRQELESPSMGPGDRRAEGEAQAGATIFG